ncbi:MAG: hypothetical protein KGZ79_01680 [Dethiobacter sp.]|jgi:hypothetical protein|nr:hypothetical protein [Dethiobacter sp.]
MKVLRTTTSVLLVIILLVNLFFLQFLLLVQYKLTAPGFYLDAFAGHGLYGELHGYLDTNLRARAGTMGVPAEALDGVITKEWVVLQAETLVSGLLDYLRGKEKELPQLDFEAPVDKFLGNVAELAEGSLGILGQVVGEAVTDRLRRELFPRLSDIPFSSNWEADQRQAVISGLSGPRKVLANLKTALYGSVSLALIIPAVIFLIWRSGWRWLNWIGTSLVTAGFLTAIPSLFAMFLLRANPTVMHGFFNSLLYDIAMVFPLRSIPDILFALSQNLLRTLLLYGSSLVVAGLLLLVVLPPVVGMMEKAKDIAVLRRPKEENYL